MLSLVIALGSCRPRYHRHRGLYMAPEANDGSSTGTVTGSIYGLNVRSGPGTNYNVIGTVGDGTKLTVVGRSGEWWRVNYNGNTGYVNHQFIHVPAVVRADLGLNIRSGPGTNYGVVGVLSNGAQITIQGINGNWDKIAQGWVCDDFVFLGGSGGGGGTPSGPVIKQSDPRFNSNINRYGCAFMSLCWLGGVNSIDGCNNLYNLAVRNGWMRYDCYINSWDACKGLAKAKYYRWGGRYAGVNANEKEILYCSNARIPSHFVVGNKNGGIEYDPDVPGLVSYADHKEKRIYGY